MEEVRLDRSVLDSLHMPDLSDVSLMQQPQLPRPDMKSRPRQKVKKTSKNEATHEAEMTSLKNEIEYMPMKTPISILQELLSRRGKISY
jgi:hypothetical protein